MRIVICDDSLEDAENLKNMLERYLSGQTEEIVVCASGEELLEREKGAAFDLLFLSIDMKAMNGLDAARELRKRGRQEAIILLSRSPAFGPQSYEVGAAWYLLKPLAYEEFARAADRGFLACGEKERKLRLSQKGGDLLVPVDRIDYIETEGRRLVVHMGASEIRVYDSLERLCRILGEQDFIRPHRSYILRMDFIERMEEGQFCLRNGEKVSMNRSRRREIKEAWKNHLFFRQEKVRPSAF